MMLVGTRSTRRVFADILTVAGFFVGSLSVLVASDALWDSVDVVEYFSLNAWICFEFMKHRAEAISMAIPIYHITQHYKCRHEKSPGELSLAYAGVAKR